MKPALVGVLSLAAVVGLAAPAAAQREDRLSTAKTLFFDNRYAEAREIWRSLQASGDAAEASAAAYWVARCSERLGERERALREYGEFLAARPRDPLLAEEAKTSRIGLAARLYAEDRPEYLAILRRGLGDASRTVRYYAALQLGGLGPEVGRPAIPVLKEIVAEESDPDLVDRARLRLLRLDPGALESGAPAARGSGRGGAEVRWVRLEIRSGDSADPELSLSFPVALAELVFKSLPEDARRELSQNGIDAANFWEQLKGLGPTRILEIEGDDGERIRLWLE
jgi:tetratricopeptide (TPR) repeat protein